MSNQNTPQGSKLDSASLLILGMESLRPGGMMQISSAAIEDADTLRDASDQQRIGTALTCAVLYAIVVELVVKYLWEQENGQTAAYNHNVQNLFEQLSEDIRHDVESLYERCCQAYKNAIDIGQQHLGAEVVAVEMASLAEALQWNEEAVKNLKYELTPRNKSVPTGIFWSSESVWVVPSTFPNFAIELTRWAARRTFTS
ncbi:MAG: hypothetical protein F4Y60_02735 [Boseongicola sp. SB0664_bin_43]|uniref:Uncharacterized protein n=1 Tax=Boseongicola sp. SB0664_bin_43 TaxID=2604844 RepID=A0A6B0XWE1_9RHOB|nr:hypothetical protein [Boseongicola sp. SB0664_bin_43]MYK33136.1 hypothetical protein [Boseongicola sp. SB0670_bin_30]